MNYKLFTGNIFPGKVFNADFEKIIVFEFDVIFRDVFAQKLSEFCLINKVEDIKIESLDRQYSLEKEIKCDAIKNDYIELLKGTFIKEELPQKLTYYILLSNFIIYSNNSGFAFYVNREFDVGILAYNTDINISMFKNLIWGISMTDIFTGMKFHQMNSDKIVKQFDGQEYLFKT